MQKRNAVITNSFMGLASQIVTLLFTFVTRKLFLQYVGVELLGLNSTFTSVLSTLSLAELGFQSAIVYSLYEPLHTQNTDAVNAVMNIFRLIYRWIGIFFVIASVAVLPVLRYILKGIEVGPAIYGYFLLQASASCCTYFLAYKRAILYADQRDYVAKAIDMGVNIVSNLLQCLALWKFRSYVGYLTVKTIQAVISNVFVHVYCNRHYPYLGKAPLDREKLREIWKNVKNIFAGRIASYVYTSTDNLVISSFVSTVTVGFLGNYTTVTNSLKTLTNSMLSSVIPAVGSFLLEEPSGEKRERMMLFYTHIRYLIAVFLLVPTAVLIDGFVTLCFGDNLLMPRVTTFLLIAELYIHLVHSATSDFINGAGLFRYERNVNIAGAVCNLVTSLVLVQFFGVAGVLIGTVVSQLVFWIGRSIVVYRQCLGGMGKRYLLYWIRNVIYLAVMVGCCFLCQFVYQRLAISNRLVQFLVGGVVCEAMLVPLMLIIFARCDEQKRLLTMIRERLCGRNSARNI